MPLEILFTVINIVDYLLPIKQPPTFTATMKLRMIENLLEVIQGVIF